MSTQNQFQNDDDLNDEEFMKKHSQVLYKTQNGQLGKGSQFVPRPTVFNNSGKFTDHLLNATMYRNNSLNSTCDKERWVNGSKDWMEHLQ